MVFLKSLNFESINTDSSILIHYEKESDDIMMINIYVNKFFLVAKYCRLLNQIKKCFKNKYNVKNLEKTKTIIEQQ